MNVRYFIMDAFGYTALAANRERNLFLRCEWIDVNGPSAAIEADIAVDECEDRVIATKPNIFAGKKFRAALTNNNVSGDHVLAAKSFYAEPLADAVAAVLNAALSFFVCHDLGFFRFRAAADRFDFYPRKFPAVTDGPVITFAPIVFERDDFFVFALFDNFGSDFATIANLAAVNVHQDLECGRFARFDIQKIDIHRVAFCDAILPSTSLDDCVGHNRFSGEKKPRKLSQKPVLRKRKSL